MNKPSLLKTSLLTLVLGLSSYAQADTDSAAEKNKIISAGASVTQIINALGAKDQLVAVDLTSKGFVDKSIPKVGYHRQLSAENLMSLSPTHLIGSDEMGPQSTLNLLEQSGVEVDTVNSGETVKDLLIRIDQIAKLTDHQDRAEKLKQKLNVQLNKINTATANIKTPKKVLFLMIHDGRPITIAGSNTTADSIITLAGAKNPAAASISNYKPISGEAIVTMQPDIILLSTRTASKIKNMQDLIAKMPLIAATPAATNNALLTIKGTALIGGLGLESVNEALKINQAIYP
ncbi:hemin ABC transporter substrate-binding protein [Photobacterium angustum]|uniref:Hemin ABC transporter substrate-binding protein n=1 Tax=Photobacterium angustum TaxID=661 RepID=A0A855SA85_PHOAN|nr:ABC transporter substrate-binding protein [Photobacterium angustum]KJF81721.1 hemin receptor [Photobacterium damselae subsp. damselae]KJG28338.1 hemin receptor [Photobacterium angustum]KJG36621.1 hemin receptor [Photobacterium angustum]KJG45395.1 hemin receptor [Photobacterium angustum]KJG46064.1 hemin receptor [Photobacterium angustum]